MTIETAPAGLEFAWTGRTGPFTLRLLPQVFRPTHTTRLLADAIEVQPGDRVLDVGCGSGILSFVAARLGAGKVVGCDLSPEAVESARANAAALGLSDRTEFRQGNVLEPVADVEADVVIGDISGIPDDVAEAAGWFPDGRSGGPTGSELPVAMLEQLGGHLAEGGRMYLPTGTIQAENRVLAVARRIFGSAGLVRVAERELPLPDAVAKSSAVGRLMADGLLNLRRRGSRLLWKLSIWRCMRPGSGP